MKTHPYSLAAILVAIMTIPAARADYSSTVTGLHPIAYYQLDETTPVPADTATNRGTLGGIGLGYYLGSVAHADPGALAATNDTSAGFAGGKVVVPYNASMNPPGSFTVEAWINPIDTSSGNRVIAISMINDQNPASSDDRSGWAFRQNGAALTFLIGGTTASLPYTTTATSSNVLTAGAWQHVAAVFTSATTNITLLVNGVPVLSQTGAAPLIPNFAAPLIMGDRGYGGWPFSGNIDEVALYTNALTAEQLLAHYQNGINPSPSQTYDSLVLSLNPILYYRFDEPAFTPTPVTAANLGSLGSTSDGNYDPGVTTGVPGVPFGGFGAGNKACGFNGAEGEVSLQLPVSATEFTITAWFKRNGGHVAGQALVFNRPNSAATGLGFGYNRLPGVDQFNVHWNEGPSSWLTGLTPPNDVWCFGAAVYAPSGVTVYLDNTSSNFVTTLAAHDFSAATTYIGWDSSYPLFNGSIDEVALFDRALSPTEVQSLFASSQMPALITSVTRTPADPIFEGSTITISPTVLGVPPFTNQWYKNNSPLVGKTSPTFSITNAVIGDSGTYQVVVGNAYGSSTSAVQVITVSGSPPVIFTQPASTAGFIDSTATFSVSAGGSQPLSYQWKRGSAPIPGATTSSLAFANIQWGDSGTFTCTISNTYGTTNTAAATLTVGGEFVSLTLPDTLPRDRHTALGSDGSNLYFTHGNTPGAEFYRIPQTALSGWTPRASLPTPDTINQDSGVGDLCNFGGALWCWGRDPNNGQSRVVYRYDIAGDTWTGGAVGSSDGPNSACAVIGTDNILGGWMGYYAVYQATDWANGVMAQLALLNGGAVHPWDSCIGPNAVYFIKHWNVAASNGVLASFTKTATPTFSYINGMPFNLGTGCAIEYMPGSFFGDGHDHLYILRGTTGTTDDDANDNGGSWTTPTTSQQLATYDLVTQTWAVQDLPFVIDIGSEMCLVNQTLYILAGNSDSQPLKMLYLGPPMSPTVVNQPVSQTNFAGQPVTFKVGVLAGGPVGYQWRHSGSPIPGATANYYTIPSAWFSDAGNYDVVVSTGAGTNSSQSASLTVLYGPPLFANLTNDLVLHLAFDGNYNDSSSHNNNATPQGIPGPTFAPGRLGQAVSVNTVNGGGIFNFVYIGAQPDFSFGPSDSFSVAFWINTTNWPNDLPMIGNAVGSTYQPGWVFAQDQNKIELSLVTSSSSGTYIADPAPASPIITDGRWHNVVGVIDRGAQIASVYVDGALAGSFSIAGLGTVDQGTAVTLGQNPDGNYTVDGAAYFDDVGIWRRALTPLDVQAIYLVAQQNASFDTFGPVVLTMRRAGTDAELAWQTGALQSSTNGVLGTYNPVSGANPPYYRFTPGPTSTFYRVSY